MIVLQILYSGLGGHSSVVFSLIEADVQRQYQHVLIFYGIEAIPDSSVDKCRELGVQFFFVQKKQGFDVSSQKRVVQILREVKPAVILLHSVNLIIPVYLYTLRQHTKVIAVEHQSNHLKNAKDWLWSGLIMLLADHIVYLTDVYRDQMEKRLGVLFNSRRVTVINNGINMNVFWPKTERPFAQQYIIKMGMLSRLNNIKDHPTLMQAFKYIVDQNPQQKFELHIAGGGETIDNLQKLGLQLGLKESVRFLGMIKETESVDFLNDIDIYVHASLGETMSTSIMQAMACGKPIIASKVQGITNMIEDGKTGLLVPPLEPALLAQRLQVLLNDPGLRSSLSNQALTYAKARFSNSLMLHSYTKLFAS